MAAATVTLVALLAGCGQQVVGAPSASEQAEPSAVDSALASFNPCTVLSDAEIAELGFLPETRRPIDMLGQVGCAYSGPALEPDGELGRLIGLRLEKDLEETVSDYAARADGVFDAFRENRVNGRAGAALVLVADGRECTQLLNAGSGTVAVGWEVREPGPTDPCAEALRVAKLIEPEVPAVGS